MKSCYFFVHKFSIIMWRHDVISLESLETVAMQGYFLFDKETGQWKINNKK